MTARLLNMAYELKGMKHDLPALKRVHEALGSPAHAFDCIHVAGTNGKGSVCLKIANALQQTGQKVGLYTSPHITNLKERICINGKPVEDLDEVLEPLFDLQLSYFEMLTLAAFIIFKENQVDIAVIEVGLGGRLDATNIIHPKLCVITSIGWDHMVYLGDTLEKIAIEKAGIIKPNIPVIIGPKARPYSVFKQKTGDLTIVKGDFAHYDEENTAIAKAALEKLGVFVPPQALSVCPACRFERWGDAILDVAHNMQGLEALFERVRLLNRPFRVVAGFSADKQIKQMLEFLHTQTQHLYLTQADHPRALKLGEQGVKKVVVEAYLQAKQQNEMLVVCGSFFIMSSAQDAMKELLQTTHSARLLR